MIGVITGYLLLFPQLVSAAEAGAYDSNGVTSFFGVYEEPVEEPEEPIKEQLGNKQVNQKATIFCQQQGQITLIAIKAVVLSFCWQ